MNKPQPSACFPKTNPKTKRCSGLDLGSRGLDALVDEYVDVIRPQVQQEIGRFKDMPDLKTAINQAALARNKDGKCDSHQRRVGLKKLGVFEKVLQKHICDIAACTTFDELHTLIAGYKTDGVGELTIYDTAVRIGYYIGLSPGSVYLHAGTRVGARNFGLVSRDGRISKENLPDILRRLSAREVEDFLCIYKDGNLRFFGCGIAGSKCTSGNVGGVC